MKTRLIVYDYEKSFERIDNILESSENSFEELDSIPSRNKLTFTNGFYVNCSALFVDIRDSSSLPSKHNRPKLAKLYRSYISEVVAIMNGSIFCSEVNVVGDGILGIFATPTTLSIDHVFGTSAEISSLIDVLNCKFRKKSISEIVVGIGMSYGRALMIKAGYKGSEINDLIWMGDVVNYAYKLASYGNRTYSDHETMVSEVFYNNLNDDNKNLLSPNYNRSCYHGNVVNAEMNEWYNENCK
jgi:class 3 adenylate cyclase